ncbi:MAG: sulfotransferase domain-containing protein [Halioglobus sp.]
MTKHKNESLFIQDPAFKLLEGQPKPDFMLIGAAKSGTTSFSSYIGSHPQVKDPPYKEPNFWTWKMPTAKHYQELFVNTESLLSPTAEQEIAGDYTADLILHPLAPRRVRGSLPHIKIVVLLRNPIERAYSHYIMSKRSGREDHQPFSAVVEKEIDEIPPLLESHGRAFLDLQPRTRQHFLMPDGSPILTATHDETWTPRVLRSREDMMFYYYTSCVFRSIYCDQLWRWLQMYPREQFMIIQSEKFFSNPKEIMNKISDFLNLQTFEFDTGELDRTWGGGASDDFEKSGDYVPMSSETRSLLSDFFKPFNESLYSLIDERFDWE